MKILIIAALSLILATCLKPIHAGELDVSFKHLVDNESQGFHLTSWRGIEFKYQPDSLYYFASYETAKATISNPMYDIKLFGVGFGFNNPVTDKINIYGQIGYYMPKTSLSGRFGCENFSCGEGLYYGLNEQWADLHTFGLVMFDEFEVNTHAGYGITLGGEITHAISRGFDLVMGVEYRVLDITTEIHGMSPAFGDYDTDGQRWETVYKGISSTNYKIGLNYSF
ncbi:MAG: hypothetical protein OQK75_11880 [Gammaproteobacteria bacterium]|nr:hypothetical protein [Gammaproteobacteria bacterium]